MLPDDMSHENALSLLREGTLREARGFLPWGSNTTLLMRVEGEACEGLAIYKPRRGERPLWDFPDGTLCLREVAAYTISERLGWHLVPPTVLRDGPYGIGMLQLFIPHNPDENYFTFGGDPTHRDQLMRIALFDHMINNADRKGGHCLLSQEGIIWAIDHGICFHTHPKLRTVIWDYAGQHIPEGLLSDVQTLCVALEGDEISELEDLLSAREAAALKRRVARLAEAGTYPNPPSGRNYPWPPV
jgi:uncharacterized repeat protein (TIGR03843 family)